MTEEKPDGAILQRDKETWAIVPRTPAGLLTPDFLENLARVTQYDFKLLNAVIDVNARQRTLMVDKIRAALGGDASGKILAVLGLSFKPNTDDMRDAPSITIIEALQAEGATS